MTSGKMFSGDGPFSVKRTNLKKKQGERENLSGKKIFYFYLLRKSFFPLPISP